MHLFKGIFLTNLFVGLLTTFSCAMDSGSDKPNDLLDSLIIELISEPGCTNESLCFPQDKIIMQGELDSMLEDGSRLNRNVVFRVCLTLLRGIIQVKGIGSFTPDCIAKIISERYKAFGFIVSTDCVKTIYNILQKEGIGVFMDRIKELGGNSIDRAIEILDRYILILRDGF